MSSHRLRSAVTAAAAFALALAIAACIQTTPSEPAEKTPTPVPFGPVPIPDLSPSPSACNPLAAPGAQNCQTGMKCTWLLVDEAGPTGQVGCVPDGTVALGGACTRGPAGIATGYDNCMAGGMCIGGASGGVCKPLCGLDGSVGCEAGAACARYAALGANGDDVPVVGVCNETCDPLKQTRLVGGTPTTCGTSQGCFLLESATDTVAVCAGAGMPTHNQPITGTTYANSCAPGHVPRRATQGASGDECAGFCKPADVYNGSNDGRMGRPDYEGGNSTETNWMNPPKAATCESAGGPTVLPSVPSTGESCTYLWTREQTSDLSAFSNTLGWCFNFASWSYDPDGMEPLNATDPFPRCIDTTTGDVLPPVNGAMPHNDALYFGCLQKPAMFTGTPSVQWTEPRLDRLGPYFQ